MDKLISLQDAIVNMAFAIWHYPNELYTSLNCFENCQELAERALNRLPSAEPEERTEERTETHTCDCIRRQDAKDAVDMVLDILDDVPQWLVDDLLNALNKVPSAETEPHWIPCSEGLPEEDYWLGGSGKQFSDEVLVSVSNSADEDVYVYVSQTLDGKWNLELPEYYEVIAWMPLPSPYQPEEDES